MILESFPLLWLALPFLVGSVAVAEERRLGTLENLLCLPTTRRFQFIVKLAVTLGFGVFLGAVLPLVLESLGRWLGVTANPSGLWVLNGSHSVTFLLLFGSVALSFLSLYGSTLTRNTLQALGAGVLVSLLGFLLIAVAIRPPDLGDIVLWRGALVGLIGGPVMVGTALALAYGNYKRLHPDLSTWFRNGLTLLVALTSLAAITTAIYHRAWETWLPPEPTHSFTSSFYASRGRHFPTTAKLQASVARVALLLPDGRLWFRHREVKTYQAMVQGRVVTIPQTRGSWRADSLPGLNWRDVAVSDTQCFAIQADGTLWEISPGGSGSASETVAREIDTNHDWKSISAGREHFTALKSDGTLWEWGGEPASAENGGADRQLPRPARVATDADWVAACCNEEMSVAVKNDGSIWRWRRFYSTNTNGSSKLKNVERPERWLEGPKQKPASISSSDNTLAVVYEDGTLWLGGELHLRMSALPGPERAELSSTQMVPWGDDSDWKEVKLYPWGRAIGTKRGGTLWQWHSFSSSSPNSTWMVSRTRPSQFSDWLAVCWDLNGYLAFAGDGTLCLWAKTGIEGNYAFNNPDPSDLLLPSRLKARRITTIPW
jgi:hypothetical protein